MLKPRSSYSVGTCTFYGSDRESLSPLHKIVSERRLVRADVQVPRIDQ